MSSFLGEPGSANEFTIKEACEPSDIIWEHRHFSKADRTKRTIIVIFAASSVLFVSFLAIFIMKRYQVRLSSKFPDVDCVPIYKTYKENLIDFAFMDWKTMKENDDLD